jgi:hypothetical protein
VKKRRDREDRKRRDGQEEVRGKEEA